MSSAVLLGVLCFSPLQPFNCTNNNDDRKVPPDSPLNDGEVHYDPALNQVARGGESHNDQATNETWTGRGTLAQETQALAGERERDMTGRKVNSRNEMWLEVQSNISVQVRHCNLAHSTRLWWIGKRSPRGHRTRYDRHRVQNIPMVEERRGRAVSGLSVGCGSGIQQATNKRARNKDMD